jgi:DNA-binding LacI/PurR family transcriptional regulator
MRTVFSATRDRVVGYAQALKAADVEIARVPIFETQSDAATVGAALEQIFASAEPPTAILAESDKIALLAVDWFAARGISVPRDV